MSYEVIHQCPDCDLPENIMCEHHQSIEVGAFLFL